MTENMKLSRLLSCAGVLLFLFNRTKNGDRENSQEYVANNIKKLRFVLYNITVKSLP